MTVGHEPGSSGSACGVLDAIDRLPMQHDWVYRAPAAAVALKEISMANLQINGKPVHVDAPADTPMLWVLRDHLGLTGTKFGCGMALCGACTVHLDGAPVRACQTPLSAAAGKKVTTIEGMAGSSTGRAVQAAWLAIGVPQCGYCQAGQIMSATALLQETPKPTDQQIDAAMSGNLCRCGTYTRIRAAIHQAAGSLGGKT
jgi:isoquinoline 1-oxidoreductase subunit alpha